VDVVPWLRKIIGKDIEILDAGALDDLTKKEIAELKPRDDHDVSVSRIRDGSEVLFGKSHIITRLQRCIDQLKQKAANLTSKPAVLSQSLLAKAIDELLT
jgi:protein AroM